MTSSSLQDLFDHNREWAARMERERPGFFQGLTQQQRPRYMWVGCSDSRVPANQITGLEPGEVFVHRNVANVVVPTDLNCLSTIQFAVDVLRVGDIIVCGHSGCGGVGAVLRGERLGLVDNWLRPVRNVRLRHADELDALETPAERLERLCELNVAEQVANVCQTTAVQDAWARGQRLAVHGWIYSLSDGLLRDLRVTRAGEDATPSPE